MFTNRLFYLIIVMALLVVTACAPQVTPTPVSSMAAFTPTMEAAPVIAPTNTPEPTDSPSPEFVRFRVTVGDLIVVGHCTGTRGAGMPVVILQSGNGGVASHLAGIERHIADRTMVCAWSRPGIGGSSSPQVLPRSVEAVVEEMHDILTALELEPPYFPIGQSGGAVIAFMFAQAYPNEVAGFVSMNPNPPYSEWVERAKIQGISQELFDVAEQDFRGENPEQIDFRGNDSMLTDPLPSTMPYAVMYDECGGSPDCEVNWEAALEESLTRVGAGGTFVWARGAGHEIHLTMPQIVYDTIDKVWSEAVGAPTLIPTTTVFEGRLLFSRFIEASHTFTGMYITQADGSAETAVPLPWTEGGGRWSRSGKEIAVATLLADGRVGTAIIAIDGTVLRVLSISDATLNLPCVGWSPDDTRIACEGWDDTDPSRNGVYTVLAADGGDIQRLTTPPAGQQDFPGDYSSAGQFIFMRSSGYEVPGTLMIVDANGGEPRILYDGRVNDAGRFSPDGRSVVTATNGSLLVIGLDGKVLHTFSMNGFYLFGPVWSPDGTRIAFSVSDQSYRAEIYTSLPDGTDLQQVTHTSENEITVDWGVGSE